MKRDFKAWDVDLVSGGDVYLTEDNDVAFVINVVRHDSNHKKYILKFFSGEISGAEVKESWRKVSFEFVAKNGGAEFYSNGKLGSCLDILDPAVEIFRFGSSSVLRFIFRGSFPLGTRAEIGGKMCDPPMAVIKPRTVAFSLTPMLVALPDNTVLAWDRAFGPEIIRLDIWGNTKYKPRHLAIITGEKLREITGDSESPVERQGAILRYLQTAIGK